MAVGSERTAQCLASVWRRQRKTSTSPGCGVKRRDLDEVAAGGLEQGLAAAAFRPVARVGGERLRFAVMELAPDAADEADAIGADALEARLMVVGRAEPFAGEGDDAGAGVHWTLGAVPLCRSLPLVGRDRVGGLQSN